MKFKIVKLAGVLGISTVLLFGCNSQESDAKKEEPKKETTNKKHSEDTTKSKKAELEQEKKEEIVKVFDINDIADKDLDSVIKSVSEGTKIDSGQFKLTDGTIVQKETYTFKDGLLEVMFLDGLAGRITITPKEKFKFDDEKDVDKAFKTFGFPIWSSDEKTENAIHFTSVGSIAGDGLNDVTVFNNEGFINYIYVITKEEYK
ncbi:hypothetical protein M3685_02335 [Heyndrickxia oleronia]|uniref:hypothetical protein n=1 Tax=Heyndrickxia oleronia TaxID=38875 RepID=UPI00203C88F3|nr:hypothetical protein [Heyndrickxia oleronia]MCM3452786.1 hypothetical protein [Heyndrickxia oleronia]